MPNNNAQPTLNQARELLSVSLQACIAGLPEETVKNLVAASLYLIDPISDEAALIVTCSGPNEQASDTQLAYKLEKRRIPLPGTSLKEALRDNSWAVFLPSGYRADHICFNLALQGGPAPALIQLVYKIVNFDRPFNSGEEQSLKKALQTACAQSGLTSQVAEFDISHRRKFFDTLSAEAATAREMFFIFCDITGSSRIAKEDGIASSLEGNALRRQAMLDTLKLYGGEAIRSEGDGIWGVFPITAMAETDRSLLLEKKVIPAAENILKVYREQISRAASKAVQQTYLRVGLSRGTLLIVREKSRYFPYGYDGEAFARLRFLTEALAPRNRHIIVIDGNMGTLPAMAEKEIKMIDPAKLAEISRVSGKMNDIETAFLYTPKL